MKFLFIHIEIYYIFYYQKGDEHKVSAGLATEMHQFQRKDYDRLLTRTFTTVACRLFGQQTSNVTS